MVNPQTIDEVVSAVEKQYGKNIVHSGSEFQRVAKIPFPSLELNIATGGGIPLGRLSRFFGAWSSGKSLTSMLAIRQAQNIHVLAEQFLESKIELVKRRGEQLLKTFPEGCTCAYYNVEKTYDKEFAEQLGVDTDKLIVIEGSVIEKVGTILEAALGAVHFHVIDSASAAVSVDELGADIEDWHRAIKPRVWGKVLDHIQDKIDNTENSVLVIDQVRNDMQTGAEHAPGGNKLEHAFSMTLHFRRGKWLYRRDGMLVSQAEKNPKTLSGNPEADGFEILARVVKSKVGRPFRSARLTVDFDGLKFDRDSELVKIAEWLGVVKPSGSWYEISEGNKVQGKKGLKEAINSDPNLKEKILEETENYICMNP